MDGAVVRTDCVPIITYSCVSWIQEIYSSAGRRGGRTIIMIRRTCIALALAPNPSFRSHPKPIANSMQSYLQCLDHMLIPSVLVVL